MEKYDKVTDERLIRDFRNGDREIMDHLMMKYKAMVRKKARAMYLFGGEKDVYKRQEGAIAVYMDHAVGENETDMDLAEKQRAARILNLQRNQGLFMEHLTMKGKITPVFAREETLDLRIRVRTTQPLKNVMFRLTLRTDSDSGLGTFWSKPVDFPATGEQDMEMSMPLQPVSYTHLKGLDMRSVIISELKM